MNTTTITEKPCQDCGTATPYEPILMGETDWSAMLPHLCPACEKARVKENEERDKAARIERARARYEAAVPPKLRETDITRPDYNLKAHKAIHHAYAMDPTRNILCFGAAGLCKSRCLARLCARAAFEGHTVAWITAHDFALLADRYRNFKTRADAQDEIIRLKKVSRLVFDDLGKHEWNPKIEEIFFTVVDHRYSHNLATWFSANTHPEDMLLTGQLSKDRGASIVGRIVENAHIFEFKPKTENP